MAWTGSTPHRGVTSCGISLAISGQVLMQGFETVKRTTRAQGALSVHALLLVAAGLAIPLIAPETMMSALFAAAGAAAIVAVLRSNDTDQHTAVSAGAAHYLATPAVPAVPQTRFSELSDSAQPSNHRDRARWAELTAHMSHELRTPLNAVLGFSEMMSQEVCGPIGSRCYSDYARNIHSSGRMLLKSAEDALAITTLLTAPEQRRTPLATCLGTALNEATAFHAEDFAARNCSIVVMDVADLSVTAEPQIVRQLLINILADVNASIADANSVAISATADAAHVQLTVSHMSVRGPSGGPSDGQTEPFSILLARTLADLSGALFSIHTDRRGCQTIVVTFARATQQDFFN